jgi:glycosyltransferase involved in cell wall biosynthesis
VLNNRKVGVVMPAYNAAATLERTFAELDLAVVDEVVLVSRAEPRLRG